MQTLRLRGILEWRNEVTSGPDQSGSSASTEVMILIWPAGEFKRLPRGTTAGEIVHDQVTWNTNYVSHPARCLAVSHCCSNSVHASDMLVTKAALLATD